MGDDSAFHLHSATRIPAPFLDRMDLNRGFTLLDSGA
jgi:hypothetical protein